MRCTCGAALPEDARFCHKCGKPQYEEDIARLNAVDEPPPPPPFTNCRIRPPGSILASPMGGRCGSRMAVAAMSLVGGVLSSQLIAPALVIPLFLAAGFTAVPPLRKSH